MKRFFLFFTFFYLASGNIFAGAVVKDFYGEAGINQVRLKWIVAAETDLKGYRILRSYDGSNFEEIAFVPSSSAVGSEKTYSYIDRTVFKSSGHTWYYKLSIVNLADESASDFDQIVVVSPQISSARQTWGSIKAMFR
jgi:hypothetical protein